MEYKGYVATVEFDDSANVLHGRVVNCGPYPIATFECTNVGELRQEFERSIDEYLAWCQEDNVAPKQPAVANSNAILSSDRPPLDLEEAGTGRLLSQMGGILAELRGRGICRTENLPTGDFAEFLFRQAFGWKLEGNSQKGFDATDERGKRYQIKGRRLTKHSQSRQLSAIRGLNQFDFLAAVLFDETYGVKCAAIIPVATVEEQSTFVERTNSYKLMLPDKLWELPDVRDVTHEMKIAWSQLDSGRHRSGTE